MREYPWPLRSWVTGCLRRQEKKKEEVMQKIKAKEFEEREQQRDERRKIFQVQTPVQWRCRIYSGFTVSQLCVGTKAEGAQRT